MPDVESQRPQKLETVENQSPRGRQFSTGEQLRGGDCWQPSHTKFWNYPDPTDVGPGPGPSWPREVHRWRSASTVHPPAGPLPSLPEGGQPSTDLTGQSLSEVMEISRAQFISQHKLLSPALLLRVD
uniref:Uncharacterized protein n=1 Tax=Molossus molossus TaxID=27622 RepID=A0A7J8JVC1_MOLMO|nr:hypothetical protein HJG59_007889 [Molossus molossus]